MPVNPLSPLARRLGQQPWVMRAAPLILPTERFLRRVSGNRFGVLDLAGLPTLRLTVAGRKSGKPRETSLLYVPHGANFLIIGSNWGNAEHPVWSANLRAADTAQVRLHGRNFPVTVTELEGAERARAWAAALAFWPGYRMEERLAAGRRFRIFELRR
ncbi:nitroreductase family deazaflavin-dependent oxidoreductase [Nocardia asteroides]|uniref:nitroreductase family deazaflavin-dependent oxidoreductase n=1 Tax=Nocardia asteroides TaxID=1824 RepID=UPI001E5E817C|nr:nitroreductase family deazaflavin-dependent oxidoreductase [Nocardia asteroides]UGT63054.1 nitroreductase family deazaflavin-dependent oxidoreductase [Nocardia asteroides]